MTDGSSTHRLDAEASGRAMNQLFSLLIEPEIARRRELGEWSEDDVLLRRRPFSRLGNTPGAPERRSPGEGEGEFEDRPTAEGANEQILVGLDWAELFDDELDHGHFTTFRVGEAWAGSFDFRYNRRLIRKHLAAALEFLDTAADALDRSRVRVFVEALFAAVELQAKSYLLLSPDESLIKSRRHGFVQSRYNEQRRLENVRPEHADS
jgi:hypothetical protein